MGAGIKTVPKYLLIICQSERIELRIVPCMCDFSKDDPLGEMIRSGREQRLFAFRWRSLPTLIDDKTVEGMGIS